MKIELLSQEDKTKAKNTKYYEAKYSVGRKTLELDIQVRDDRYAIIKMHKNPKSTVTEELTLKNGKPTDYLIKAGGQGNSWQLRPNNLQDEEHVEEFKKAFKPLRKVDDFMKSHPEYFEGLF
jgi:hypothetical protein